MNPYPELVEVEGTLEEVGFLPDKSGYGILVQTEDGPVSINNLRDDDVERLLPGIGGRVRITIEPIDEEEDETIEDQGKQ